jgi:hypothetical protein
MSLQSIRRLWLEELEDRTLPSLSATSWTPLGPAPVFDPNTELGYPVGRTAVMAGDPNNSSVMFLGSDNGGIWRTTNWDVIDPDNAGLQPTWTPLTDQQSSPSPGLYQSLIVVPVANQPNTVYAAVNGPGGGVLKSTDNGDHWRMMNDGGKFSAAQFASIAVSPIDPNTVYVCVTTGADGGGVYKSTGGVDNWTNTTSAAVTGAATDLVMNPTNPAILYTGIVSAGSASGVYETTTGGGGWTLVNQGLTSGANIGATIRLAMAPTDPNTIYATIFDLSLGSGYNGGGVPTRFVTITGGQQWTSLNPLPNEVIPNNPGLNDFQHNQVAEYRYWHVLLAVDPINSSIVYANDAYAFYSSTDGGQHWYLAEPFHDDFDGLNFDGSQNMALFGDRGVYLDQGQGAVPRTGNLETTEFYDFTPSQSNANVALGVAQDHGYFISYSGQSTWQYAGDGYEAGRVLIDPQNPANMYGYLPLLADSNGNQNIVMHSNNGGQNWYAVDSGIATSDWSPSILNYPFAYATQKSFQMDPGNSQRLVVGTTTVYETTNGGGAWNRIGGILSNSPQEAGRYITALALAPSDSQTFYAATGDGQLWATHDHQNWTKVDSGLTGVVVDIHVDPANANHVFVVTHVNNAASGNIWMTTNGGASSDSGSSWTNITGNLPSYLTPNTLYADWRTVAPYLYVGTNRGVYRSTDLGRTWSYFADLPVTAVTDLEFTPQQGGILAAATFGRGAWEILLPRHPPTVLGEAYPFYTNTPVTVGSATGVLARASDAENDPMTAVLQTPPAHGQLALNADGSFTYTPGNGFQGTDQFTFVAHDQDGTSNVGVAVLSWTSTVTLSAGSQANDGNSDVFRILMNEGNLECLINGVQVVSVASSAISAIQVNGSSDNDSLVVDYSGGSITQQIAFDGGSGSNTLIADDHTNTRGALWSLHGNSITRSGSIGFKSIRYLDIDGGGGSNLYTISDTPAGVITNLNTGGGSNAINVEGTTGLLDINQAVPGPAPNSTTVNVGGTTLDSVRQIHGAVNIENTAAATTVNVNNSADKTNHTVTLSTVTMANDNDGDQDLFCQITNLAPAVIRYEYHDTLSPVNISGGNGSNTFKILSTGGQTLNLFTGTGTDAVNVQAISGPLNITGGVGSSSTVTLGSTAPAEGGVLANLNGVITVGNTSGRTTLVVDDAGDQLPRVATITSIAIIGLSPQAINYTGPSVSNLQINGSNGDDTVNVDGTALGTATALYLGHGSNTVNVGPTAQSVTSIVGRLTVNGEGTTSLVIDDQADTSSRVYTLTPSSVTIAPPKPFNLSGVMIGYNQITSVTLNAGSGNNTLVGPDTTNMWDITGMNRGQLASVLFRSMHNLKGGASTDLFRFSDGMGVTGTIDGGGGTNELDYSAYSTGVDVNLATGHVTGAGSAARIQTVVGSPEADHITSGPGTGTIRGYGGNDVLADGGAGPVTFRLGPNQGTGSTVTGTGAGDTLVGDNVDNAWAVIGNNSGTVNGIAFTGIANLSGGAYADAFAFKPGGSISGRVDGRGGANTLDYSAFGAPIVVNLASAAATATGGFAHIQTLVGTGKPGDTLIGSNLNTIWTVSGTNAGTAGYLHFSAILNLTGGTGNDTFRFFPGGSIHGMLDGGGGSNTLDYSAYTGGVMVNLATGTATGTGGIVNIQTVHGDQGSDILVGATGPVTLIGGAGPSLLIGGVGSATLQGGKAGDLLIGEATSFDANIAALVAILAEWSRTDLSYQQRIDHLRGITPGGRNGSFLLKASGMGQTVIHHNSTARDGLTGGLGQDWFWAQHASEVKDQAPDEVLN